MKKKFVVCLIIGLMVAPVMLFAENGAALQPQAIQADTSAAAPLRDDIVAMRKDLERLYGETDVLAEKLEGTEHDESATKIQEHVKSIIQRTQDLEKKLDAETGGVMASFKEKPAKDGSEKAK